MLQDPGGLQDENKKPTEEEKNNLRKLNRLLKKDERKRQKEAEEKEKDPNRPLWTPDPSDDEDWPLAAKKAKKKPPAKKDKNHRCRPHSIPPGGFEFRPYFFCRCLECQEVFEFKVTHDLHVKIEHSAFSKRIKTEPGHNSADPVENLVLLGKLVRLRLVIQDGKGRNRFDLGKVEPGSATKPDKTYAVMIREAILEAPDRKLELQDIYR